MSNWELDLARGEWFEENVTRPWLKRNRPNWWITDSRNHKRTGGFKGPKLVKGDAELTLPDFRLDFPEEDKSSWLDAKMKSSFFTIQSDPTNRYYSLDPRSYNDYVMIAETFPKMGFEILFGCKATCKLWLLDFKNTAPLWHEFKNQYVRKGQSLTPCYSTSQMIFAGMWQSYSMP